ncbi:MAG TPA: hypothetical protein VHT49_00930, partial [Acidimicrobiales bacterium]|nr:hypothetical protein [Acidimicrobiales bacterium]
LGLRDIALHGVERPIPATSIGMPILESDRVLDPICGLPLSESTAEETARDPRGFVVAFCSPGCLDTWQRRPTSPSAELESSSPGG